MRNQSLPTAKSPAPNTAVVATVCCTTLAHTPFAAHNGMPEPHDTHIGSVYITDTLPAYIRRTAWGNGKRAAAVKVRHDTVAIFGAVCRVKC